MRWATPLTMRAGPPKANPPRVRPRRVRPPRLPRPCGRGRARTGRGPLAHCGFRRRRFREQPLPAHALQSRPRAQQHPLGARARVRHCPPAQERRPSTHPVPHSPRDFSAIALRRRAAGARTPRSRRRPHLAPPAPGLGTLPLPLRAPPRRSKPATPRRKGPPQTWVRDPPARKVLILQRIR